MTKGPTQIDRSKSTFIPKRVAVCPGCGARLFIDIQETYEDESGATRAGHFTLQCTREPWAGRGKRRDAWEETHRLVGRMPYVYWLPVHQDVEEWLKTVEIVDSELTARKLAEWNAWAEGGGREPCHEGI